jgi:transposase-like protein
MKKHKNVEIAAKLAQAADLVAQRKVQSVIARILGVSVMTLHRWRKLAPTTKTPTLATYDPNHAGLKKSMNRCKMSELANSNLRTPACGGC